jgi:hypothetical protein
MLKLILHLLLLLWFVVTTLKLVGLVFGQWQPTDHEMIREILIFTIIIALNVVPSTIGKSKD